MSSCQNTPIAPIPTSANGPTQPVAVTIEPSATLPAPIVATIAQPNNPYPATESYPAAELSSAPYPEPVVPELDDVQPIETVMLKFDGARSFEYLEAQMAIGPARYPGSEGHWQTGELIIGELRNLEWQVEIQPFTYQGVNVRNIIGKANAGKGPIIMVAAHYDTRKIADQTAGAFSQGLVVPGAVDGASGVAVLLELARTLNLNSIPREIWLVFFDAEDNGSGGIPGWDWIVGSQYMADNLTVAQSDRIEALVLVDLIGDADQQLYYEGNSDTQLQTTIWALAAELGYGDVFIPEMRHTMIDDHLPFMRKGITAIDIIDFDYPYWHTVEDTADKASPESLARVGRTIEYWLEYYLE